MGQARYLPAFDRLRSQSSCKAALSTARKSRNHTKGMCALGSFVGTPEAASYSRSALFSGSTIPVVARFSLAGGNPKAADTEKSPRGMALEFRLSDGSKQHMTMLNTPMFLPRCRAPFSTRCWRSSPIQRRGSPTRRRSRCSQRPMPTIRGKQTFSRRTTPPGYANTSYYGIHTFKFLNKANETTLVKWQFDPEDGEEGTHRRRAKSMPADFLEQALIERTKQEPVKWDMWMTVGEPGDPETDPTLLWPKGRKEVKAGTLTFTAAMPQDGAECKSINSTRW